jgi:hypothetical protein
VEPAVLAELDEADHPVRWALGALVVVAREGRLALAPPVLALEVFVCLAGAVVADETVIVTAWSRSALAIVALVFPTGVAGLVAAIATLRRSPRAPALAWSFFAFVAVVAMLAFTNARPVATVFSGYERSRINGSAFALLFAFVFAVAVTRRRVTHT